MSITYRRTFPLMVTIIAGIIPLLSYFIKNPTLLAGTNVITGLASRLMNYAFILSTAILIISQAKIMIKRGMAQESIYNAIFLVTITATAGSGIFLGQASAAYTWIINHIYIPPGQAMMVTMLLFWVSGYYRVFRIKNVETVFTTIAFIIVVLNISPIGQVISPSLPLLRDWMTTNLYANIKRAIVIGAAIGAVILSIRVLLGMERGFLRME